MNILAINASKRKSDSICQIIINQICKGARNAGANCKSVLLRDKKELNRIGYGKEATLGVMKASHQSIQEMNHRRECLMRESRRSWVVRPAAAMYHGINVRSV
jgi:multimeric flavodoxin WrbA